MRLEQKLKKRQLGGLGGGAEFRKAGKTKEIGVHWDGLRKDVNREQTGVRLKGSICSRKWTRFRA